ncbi:MAG: SMI1/KNR4 family protein [Corynebacterium glutamicum]|nr:SMI1/KNR4 family protein [Corynebacterium glutamicum]
MAFPVTEDKIQAAEETLGRRLPDSLRERLLQNNGGEVIDDEGNDWILHPVRDDSDRKGLPEPPTTSSARPNLHVNGKISRKCDRDCK